MKKQNEIKWVQLILMILGFAWLLWAAYHPHNWVNPVEETLNNLPDFWLPGG